MQFAVRFAIGGFIIALLPVIAGRIGSRMAGLMAVLPVTIGIGLIVLLQAKGATLTKAAAISSLYTLPATATFLIVIIGLIEHPYPVLAFALALAAWCAVASAVYMLAR